MPWPHQSYQDGFSQTEGYTSGQQKCHYTTHSENWRIGTGNESVQRIINAIAEKQRVLTDINERILEETNVEDIENEITDTDKCMFDLQTKVSDVSKLINTNVQTTADNQNLNQNQAQQETIFQVKHGKSQP